MEMNCCNEGVGTEGVVNRWYWKKIKQEERCGELTFYIRDDQELECAGNTQDIWIRCKEQKELDKKFQNKDKHIVEAHETNKKWNWQQADIVADEIQPSG